MGGFSLDKAENVGIEGIAYYDGQFKAEVPEQKAYSLFPFHYKNNQRSLFLSSPALYFTVH